MGFIAVWKAVLAGKEACVRIRVGRDHKVHCDITFCEENYLLTGNLIDRTVHKASCAVLMKWKILQ